MDRPTSQTTMELCHACVAFFGGGGAKQKHNSFLIGPIHPSSPTTKENHGPKHVCAIVHGAIRHASGHGALKYN